MVSIIRLGVVAFDADFLARLRLGNHLSYLAETGECLEMAAQPLSRACRLQSPAGCATYIPGIGLL